MTLKDPQGLNSISPSIYSSVLKSLISCFIKSTSLLDDTKSDPSIEIIIISERLLRIFNFLSVTIRELLTFFTFY